MKLHLPNLLRKAVLSCMTAFAGLSSTVATGALAGGVVAFALCAQVQAETHTITESGDTKLTSLTTSSDTIIFDLEGSLITSSATSTRVQANVQINKLNITSAVDNHTYTFTRKVTGDGDFCFTGVEGGDGLQFQFLGDMSKYTGNMIIADDKKGTFWFQNNSQTGTGYISALNAESVVKIGSAKIYNSSITAGIINVTGSATFKGDITLKATTAFTHSGNDTWFQGAVTLGSLIENTGKMTFFDDIILDSSMNAQAVTPQTNGFAQISYQIITGSGTIKLEDGVSIKTHTGKVLYTQTGDEQAFTGTISGAEGTVFYIVENGTTVKASAHAGETGYVISAAGSVLELDENVGMLKDYLTVDVGKGNSAEVLLKKDVTFSGIANLVTVSGKLNFTLDSGTEYNLISEGSISGALGVKDGATLKFKGDKVLANIANVKLMGSADAVAKAELTGDATIYNGLELCGNALVTGKTLNFASSYQEVTASGTDNIIASDITGDEAVMFYVAGGGELKLTGKVNHTAKGTDIFYKMDDGTLVLAGSENNIAGQVCVYGGEMQFAANANLQGGAAVGSGSVLTVKNGAATSLSELKLDKGGAFSVDATSSANISELIGKGTITVAEGGELYLTTINSNDAITVNGTAITGVGFTKTGAGVLTLDVLKINGEFNMNGHTGLNAKDFAFTDTVTLVYGAGDVLSIGEVTSAITLDVSKVVAQLDTETGLDTGISLGGTQSLADLQNLLTVQGINGFSLSETDGRVWLKAAMDLSESWDANWGFEGLAATPDDSAMVELTVNKDIVSLKLSPTELIGGGTADTIVAGGIYRDSTATATDQSGNSWIKVLGGTYHAIVGGNVNVGSDDEGCASFVGDTHIQTHGGTMDYIVGGNMSDYARPLFEGNTYVSVYQGTTVNKSVIGGSVLSYGQPVVVDGNTHVFVYTVLTDPEPVSPAEGEEATPVTPGFVLGGSYHESVTGAVKGITLSVTGSTNVTVDLSGYEAKDGAPTDFNKNIVGGHYVVYYSCSSSVGEATNVTVVGKQGITFSGDIVGGTWTQSYANASAVNTNLTISGDGVYTGRVVAGHLDNGLAGATEVTGVSKLTIDGGTFNNYVVGGSSLASVEKSQSGSATVKAVDMAINGGDFNAMLVGGSLVAPADGSKGYTASGAGVESVTMTLKGADTTISSLCGGLMVYDSSIGSGTVGSVTINADGAEIGTMYGGSYVENGTCDIKQGDIVINLNSGKLTGALYAAGGVQTSGEVTTASTMVNVGKDFDFSAVTALSGGYYVGGSQETVVTSITGDSTLSFAAGNTYTNTAYLNAVDFSRVEVGEGAVASLASISNAAGSLTKSGAGELKVSGSVALDSIVLQGGKLNVGGVSSSNGLTVQATPGATLGVNGDLTLAALKVNMEGFDGKTPILAIAGKLSGFGTDNELAIELDGYEKVAQGSYVLAEMGSVEGNLNLKYAEFEGAPDGFVYELVLNGTSLVFNYRALSEWTWQGSADGEPAVWGNDSDDGWKYEGDETPNGEVVYFTAAGAEESAGNGVVVVSGTVTPGGMEMMGGEYTFESSTDKAGDIQLGDEGVLNIGSAATLNMAMDNDNLGGTTNLQGTLVLQSANAMGNTELKFNGGTLVYGEGIDTDLSAQTSAETGLKIEVSDADTAVTWGKSAATNTDNSGVIAALNHGLEKTGAGDLTLQIAQPDTATTYAGDLSVKQGKLTIKSLDKGEGALTIAKGGAIALDSELVVDSTTDAAGKTAIDVAGDIAGSGTLSLGGSSSADYRISGDNSKFAGTINLAATGGTTTFAGSSSAGKDGAVINLNGATFSVGNSQQAVRAQLVVTDGKTSTLASVADTTFYAAPTGTGTLQMTGAHTATFSGAVDSFEGAFSTDKASTITLGGKNAAALKGAIVATLKGAGTFRTDYADTVVLAGAVEGNATLQQSGAGKLIIASDNTTAGALTVDKGKVVQLGDAGMAGTWAGSALQGEGSFILTHGALSGLTNKADTATLAVKTTQSAAATFAMRAAAASTVVDLRGSDATLLDSINLAEGSKLIVDDNLIAGGTGNMTLDLALGAANLGTDLDALSAMIEGGSLTIDGTEGVSMAINQADLLASLNNKGESDLYLQITNKGLKLGEGIDINALITPKLLGMGVRAQLTEDGEAKGYVVINGEVGGVYFTDNQEGGSDGTVKVTDATLSLFDTTVVNQNDTLIVYVNTDVNNLNGQSGSKFVVTAGATVMLNNAMPDGSQGVNNVFDGKLEGEDGTSINVMGADGSLTVNDSIDAANLNVNEGKLIANGSTDIDLLTISRSAVFELGSKQKMELGSGTIAGTLSGGEGSSLVTTGTVALGDGTGGKLEGVALEMKSGSSIELNDGFFSEMNLASLKGDKGAVIRGTQGSLVQVNGDMNYAGALKGDGHLIASGGKLLFNNATGSSGWNVEAYNQVEIDATNGTAMQLGQLSLKEGSSLTLRFNSDMHKGNNFNIFDMNSLDLSTGADGAAVSITLVSTGVAQLEEGSYILGTLDNGVSFDGLSFQSPEVELTDLPLQLQGEAFSRIDLNKSTLIAADGKLTLNLVKSDENAFEMAGAEKNVSAGAELLWKAVTPEDGDLQAVYNAVNYMIADGNKAGAQKAMAAVAGASATTLGMAFAGDVERQLRSIRNRTTTMGVNQCVYNENMPYVNAWVNAEGDYKSVDKDGYAPGYTLESWGGTIGVDVDVNPQLTLGLAITGMYGDLTADGPEDVAEGDLDTTYISAFMRYATRTWTHTFIATYGELDATMERTVRYGNGSYKTEGETDGSAFGLMYELTRTYALDEEGDACWQPIFNVAYRHTAVSAYTEKKSDAALKVDEQSLDTFTISAGARMQAIVGENLYERTSVLELRALAKVDLGDRVSEANVALINGTGRSEIESAELGAFGVELGAGLHVPLGAESGTLFFDVSAELRSGYSNVNGSVGWRINF